MEHLRNQRQRSRAVLARVARPWQSHPDSTTPAPSLTTAVFRVGDRDSSADWVMEEQRTKTRRHSRAVLARVVRPWRFLLDTVIPAPSLTTGVFRAGDAHTTAIWVLVEQLWVTEKPKHPHHFKPPLHLRAALARVAQPWRFLPEMTIPVPSSTTARFHAGGEGVMASWAMEKTRTKTRQRSRAALARVARPWQSHPDSTTPAPSLTTAVFRVGDRDSSADWVMEEQRTKTRRHSRAVLARVVRPWRFLLDTVIPAPSLTTGVFRVGGSLCTWVMEYYLAHSHQRSRAALAPAVLQHYQNVILMGTGHTRFFKRIRISILKNNQSPREEHIRVPYWITVRSPAGVRDCPDNWVMVAQSTSLRPHQLVLSEQTVLPLPSLQVMITRVPFSTTARFHAGGEGIMASWAMVERKTALYP